MGRIEVPGTMEKNQRNLELQINSFCSELRVPENLTFTVVQVASSAEKDSI